MGFFVSGAWIEIPITTRIPDSTSKNIPHLNKENWPTLGIPSKEFKFLDLVSILDSADFENNFILWSWRTESLSRAMKQRAEFVCITARGSSNGHLSTYRLISASWWGTGKFETWWKWQKRQWQGGDSSVGTTCYNKYSSTPTIILLKV